MKASGNSFMAPSKSAVFSKRSGTLYALVALAVLAWAFLIYQAQAMEHMNCTQMFLMPNLKRWAINDLFAVFVMWTVMMAAMMIPSVTLTVLLFESVNRKKRENENSFIPTWIFLSGYLLVWAGFSFLVTLAQWFLHTRALLSEAMVSTSPLLGGFLWIAAGIFQWTPLKNACLSQCRSPLTFLTTEWREGKWGALVMGVRHGIFCLGCCWMLMLLLFVLGVMNLYWIGALTLFVLLEKTASSRFLANTVTGSVLILWGAGTLLRL